MGNVVNATLQIGAAVGNGIALSQSRGSAGNLTLNGSLATGGVATLTPARRVIVTSAGDDSSITFTITGTNRYGNALSEIMQGANGAATSGANGYSASDFLTVTQIAASGATASTVTAGTTTVASTDWQGWTILLAPFQVGMAVESDGATTYSVEHTYDDPNANQSSSPAPTSNIPPVVWVDPTLNGMTANAQAAIPGPGGVPSVVWASRLTITSGTGAVKFQAIQAGVSNY